MINVTNCHKVQDENRGVNEKHWIDLDGRIALFKKTQIRKDGTHTNAHYAESLVSDLCKKVHFSCAEIDIAKNGDDIGCVSYSFLENGDELIDFVALIQNIRLNFDSKTMLVPETNEKYSIPLILEALEEESKDKEEYNALKKEFLKSCIIDSLIEHYDRNPSNISVIRNKNGIKLSPMFDNGTSLGVSIPKDVVEENITNEKWFEEIREKNKSKVGVEGEKYSHYDVLLKYILSNYFGDVKEFLETIDKELTLESIQEILNESKYADLDTIYKDLVQKKVLLNKQKLLELSKNYELKYNVEEIMTSDHSSEILNKMIESGKLQSIIPEISQCVNCPQRSKYHIYDVDEYMFRCIEEINSIEEKADESNISLKLSDKEKRTIQWSIMFNEMGKPIAREEIFDNKQYRDIFRNYSEYGKEIAKQKMEELNFYDTEKEDIIKLISSHAKRSLDSEPAVKKLIELLGEKNIDLYLAMKLAEINCKNPELREESIENLKVLQNQIQDIQKNDNRNIVKALPQNGKKLSKLGIEGSQIGLLQKRLASYVREDESMYAYYKSRGHLEKYRKQLNEYANKEAREIKLEQKKLKNDISENKDIDKSKSSYISKANEMTKQDFIQIEKENLIKDIMKSMNEKQQLEKDIVQLEDKSKNHSY